MLRPKNEIDVPPSCYWYMVPETQTRVPFVGVTSFHGCVTQVVQHYRLNNLDVPSGLREKIQEFCCKHTAPGFCIDSERSRPDGGGGFGVGVSSVEQVMRGTKALASWVTEGKESEEKARQRAQSCISGGNEGAPCPHNKDVAPHCPKCKRGMLDRLKALITRTLQGEPEPWEQGLNYCELCGCSLRLKVRTKIGVLEKQIQSAEKKQLPDFCWIKKELEADGQD